MMEGGTRARVVEPPRNLLRERNKERSSGRAASSKSRQKTSLGFEAPSGPGNGVVEELGNRRRERGTRRVGGFRLQSRRLNGNAPGGRKQCQGALERKKKR